MGVLDAPARQYRSMETLTAYGHSYGQIAVLQPTTTISAATAGATTVTVASAAFLQTGHVYTIADAGDYQHAEQVWIAGYTGTTVTLRTPLVADHASGSVFVDHSFMCLRRLAKMCGDASQFTNRTIGGAFLNYANPSQPGGFGTVMQLHPKPPGVYGDPSPGLNCTIWGTNDLGQTQIAQSGGYLPIVEAGRHAYRACQARFNLVVLYEAETAFPAQQINTTYGGSGWSTTATTNFNSGTGYASTGSSGATITHALPAGTAADNRRIVDFCFLGTWPAGSIPSSTLTFTVDGTTVNPIGGNSAGPYSASNPFRTDSQQTAAFNSPLPCVARIAIDNSAHSIVVTSGSGGVALDWIGYEADYNSPTIHTNVCVAPSNTDSTPTAVPYWNAMMNDIRIEFGSTNIAIADIYSVMSPGGTPLTRAWNASLDPTHPNTYGNGLIAQAMYQAWNRLSLTPAAVANL